MIKQPLGKTGATQKDAIFEIVKKLSGDLYTPDLPMKPIIENLGPKYLFKDIVNLVLKGIEDGSIISKHNKSSSVGERKTYAYQIVQYSLKHDKRLNGGKVGAQEAKKRRIASTIIFKINHDSLILEMKKLLTLNNLTEADKFEIESYINGVKFKIILEENNIDIKSLPENLLVDLKIVERNAA